MVRPDWLTFENDTDNGIRNDLCQTGIRPIMRRVSCIMHGLQYGLLQDEAVGPYRNGSQTLLFGVSVLMENKKCLIIFH